ncbi:transient receptor potential cation channel protein painless-like [Cloeon dipterum]|uniref:transient receptor potential cation channel protein painless-like n=1 Tax=Cloeon dipterum TaxID=197152 RepID=UPI00322047F2
MSTPDLRTVREKVETALRNDSISNFKELIKKFNDRDPFEAMVQICTSKCCRDDTRCNFATLLLNNFNVFNSSEHYPLHEAAQLGLHHLVFVLLNHPKNFAAANYENGQGQSPVHCSIAGIEKGCVDKDREKKALLCIRLLYKKSCDLDKPDKDGFTAVHLACQKKLWQIVSFCLDKNVNIDKAVKGESARDLIRKHNQNWVPKLVFTDSDGRQTATTTPYTDIEREFKNLATTIGDTQELKRALNGIGVNLLEEHGKRLLCHCVEEGLLSGLQVLVDDFHMDVTKDKDYETGMTILHRAVTCEDPNYDVVKFILGRAKENDTKFSDWIEAVDVGSSGGKGCTALQYAAWQQRDDLSKLLLEYGSTIFSKNKFTDKFTFEYLRVDLLHNYLDKQLRLSNELNLADKDYNLTFDFNFLRTRNRPSLVDQRSQQIQNDNSAQEEHLEMNGLKLLADSRTHASLLVHPVIRAFLHLKWYRLFWAFWLNFAFYATFVISVCVFACNSYNIKAGDQNWWEYTEGSFFLKVTTILLFVREVFQMILYRLHYWKIWENWMELIIIVMAVLTLLRERETLAAILVLLAFAELTLMIGRQHPSLAIYIEMFLIVCRTFFKCLLVYVCLVIAFGIAFYIIFPFCKTGEECKNSFNTIKHSIFKAIVMMSNEYDAGDIDFDYLPVVSHIIFIAFMFVVSFVMVNLLNGLAVSDIQEIRNQAKLISSKYQARIFYDLEHFLTKFNKINRQKIAVFGHFTLIDGILKRNVIVSDGQNLPSQGSSSQDVEAARAIPPSLFARMSQRLCTIFRCCSQYVEASQTDGEQLTGRRTNRYEWEMKRADNQVVVFLNDNYHVIPDVCSYDCVRRVARYRSVFNSIVEEAMNVVSYESKGQIGPKYPNFLRNRSELNETGSPHKSLSEA